MESVKELKPLFKQGKLLRTIKLGNADPDSILCTAGKRQ